MTWWDKLKQITRREAAAVREELGNVAESLDEALARKERELNATPAERVDMLLEEIEDEDSRFGELETKLRSEGTERAEAAGIQPPVPAQPAESPTRGIRHTLVVDELDPEASPEHMSHAVQLDGHVLATLGEAGLNAAIADLQVEVMVLDVARREHQILLRTPTLSMDQVADLVARAAAPHLPPAPADGPAPSGTHDD